MKGKKSLAIAILAWIALSSCALSELTDSATSLINEANDLMQLIDARVESGELDRELGEFVDERIENLIGELEDALANSGGRLFDSLNGTLDSTFANVRATLNDIKEGILDESVPNIIRTLSEQLLLQENAIAGHIEDIVVLTFGNTFVLLDKATNSAVILICIGLLALGIILFAVIFLLRRRKMGTAAYIGLGLVALYCSFLILLIFVSPLRGRIIAGFDFSQSYKGTKLEPSIRGVIPERFVFGSSQRIILYGRGLDELNEYSVGLYQGQDSLKFAFPASAVVGATPNRIVLGNFASTLGWTAPSYAEFRSTVIGPSPAASTMEAVTSLGLELERLYWPDRPSSPAMRFMVDTQPISLHPSVMSGIRVKESLISSSFLPLKETGVLRKMTDFFRLRFKLPEGDFMIRLKSGEDFVESAQFMTFFNPPPPAPKPDIWLSSISWDGGMAVKGKPSSLRLRLCFSHPESIESSFSVKVTASPADIPAMTLTVSPAQLAEAKQNMMVDIISSPFSPRNSGTYSFSATADQSNQVMEKNEGNNGLSAALTVKRFVYDVKVSFTSFEPKKSKDHYGDEYRLTCSCTVTGAYPPWIFRFKKNGEPGNVYTMGHSTGYSSLNEGYSIILGSSCYEEDNPDWGDANDSMGSTVPYTVFIHDKSETLPFILDNGNYRVIGSIAISQRAQ